MLIRIVAVGTRMPAWVTQAVEEYMRRVPPDMRIGWREVKAEPRGASAQSARWMQREADRMRAALPDGALMVALDERGDDVSTADFARRLARWRDGGRAVALLIGGPDGIDASLKAECAERLRLSSLTLP